MTKHINGFSSVTLCFWSYGNPTCHTVYWTHCLIWLLTSCFGLHTVRLTWHFPICRWPCLHVLSGSQQPCEMSGNCALLLHPLGDFINSWYYLLVKCLIDSSCKTAGILGVFVFVYLFCLCFCRCYLSADFELPFVYYNGFAFAIFLFLL